MGTDTKGHRIESHARDESLVLPIHFVNCNPYV